MRTNLLRVAGVLAVLASPLAAAPSAFAYAGDNWNYATDSWPLIQTWMRPQTQSYAAAPSSTASDATLDPNTPFSRQDTFGPYQDYSGVTHYGTHNPVLGRDSQD